MIPIKLLTAISVAASPNPAANSSLDAKKLADEIKRERENFVQRENVRNDLLTQLDELNHRQNTVRTRVNSIVQSHQELTMALNNLTIELSKQMELEEKQKRHFSALLRIAYQIQQQGPWRFLLSGQGFGSLITRMRVMHHTVKTQTTLSNELSERAKRLQKGEQKLNQSKAQIQTLLVELKEQEGLLSDLLKRKHQLLSSLNKKQGHYQAMVKQYKRISSELAQIFDGFESNREKTVEPATPRSALPLPVEFGKIIQNFGKQVNQKFKTVTFNKGIEIEANHDAAVSAVMPGTIEYSGWMKGLGNVMILHHGSGFYTLYAHLFRVLKQQASKVSQGETIATVGDTGDNEKASLYFEVRQNGKAVDPLVFFSNQALKKLN